MAKEVRGGARVPRFRGRTAGENSGTDNHSAGARSRRTVLVPSYAGLAAVTAASKKVWLTLDDGPHPTHTNKILDVLDNHNIKATFFVLGSNVANHAALVKKAFDAGHRIGNHTYTHRDLTTLSAAQIKEEIERTERLIKNYLGADKMFRPPYGAHNRTVDRVAMDLGYRLVLWNVDTLDWNRNYQPDKWVQHGVDQIRARQNSTVIAHDIHRTTANNFNMFIERVEALGDVIFEQPSVDLVA